MKLSLIFVSSLLFESIFTLAATAQVTTDGTTSTTVTPTETGVQIDDGDRAGGNLFHSFGEFSVPTGSEAYFNNANDLVNIFSRVTGGNISNIDGLLRANGTANLFLINPAGILFGPNASLQLGGSFYGSTADSIIFSNGEFSATNLDNPPLITINAPIGLGFRDNPANITNRSTANNVGLQVGTGETISFSGGEVSFDGGVATAPQGKIEVLGDKVSLVNNASTDVSSDTGGGLVLIGGEYQGRETLFNASRIYIDDTVTINADALTNGNGGRVIVWANEIAGFYGDISARGGSVSGNGGFVEVSGREHLIFRGNVDTSAVNGFTGTLLLDPDNIIIANGSGDESADGTDTFGGNNSGEAGSILSTLLSEVNDTALITIFETELEGLSGDTNVILQATNNITLKDLADDELTFAPGSGIIAFTADADRDGVGNFAMEDNIIDSADTIKTNGRNIAISGANLTLGNIDTSLTPPDNAKNSPETAQVVSNSSGVTLENISGNLSESDSADVYQIFVTGDGTFSASTVDGTTIDTQLFLFDASGLGIYGNDDAASCVDCFQSELPAENPSTPTLPGIYYLAISQFTVEPVSSEGRIFPDAFDTETSDFQAIVTPTGVGGASPLTGFESEGFSAGNYTIALTGVEGTANTFNEINQLEVIRGNGGEINLAATNGNITTGNLISSSDFGEGGAINLNAAGDILIGKEASSLLIDSSSSASNAANINLNSSQGNINLTNITINSYSQSEGGRGGDLNLNAREQVTLSGVFTDSSNNSVSENNSSDNRGTIKSGDIDISAGSVSITNFSNLNTETFGQGNAGNISITVTNNGELNLSDSFLTSSTYGQGNAGNIELNAGSVRIAGYSYLSTETLGQGNAGDIKITANNNGEFKLIYSDLVTSTNGTGNAGDINVTAGSIFMKKSNIDGGIGEDFSFDEFSIDSELFLFDSQGNLLAENDDSDTSDGAAGSTSGLDSFIEYTFTEDGNYTIGVGAYDSFAENGAITGDTIASGQNYTLQVSLGNHSVTPETNGLVSKVEPNNSRDAAQNIDNSFTLNSDSNIQNSTTIPHVSINAEGNGTFDYYSFSANQGSVGIFDIDDLSNNTPEDINLQAGNINLEATSGNIQLNNSELSASTVGRGMGGNINLTTPESVYLSNNSKLSTEASGVSDGGNIKINADFVVAFPNQNNDIVAKAQEGDGGRIDITVESLLGIEERPLSFIKNNSITNDINASSEFGLNGNVSINTLDINSFRETTNLAENPVSTEVVTAFDACSISLLDNTSGLVIKGKGGILSQPINPLTIDTLIIDQEAASNIFQNNNGVGAIDELPLQGENFDSVNPEIHANIQPVAYQDNGEPIYLARGVIKQKDGSVILTAYPTDNTESRTVANQYNCD